MKTNQRSDLMEKQELMKFDPDVLVSEFLNGEGRNKILRLDRIETLYKANPSDLEFKRFYNSVRKSFKLNEV
jgi:hypothetical protein